METTAGYKFERGCYKGNDDHICVSLSADQIAKIDAVPHQHLTLDEIIVAGILALESEAQKRKSEAALKRAAREKAIANIAGNARL